MYLNQIKTTRTHTHMHARTHMHTHTHEHTHTTHTHTSHTHTSHTHSALHFVVVFAFYEDWSNKITAGTSGKLLILSLVYNIIQQNAENYWLT